MMLVCAGGVWLSKACGWHQFEAMIEGVDKTAVVRQERKICIVVPSVKARGTSKIVSDYKSYFEQIGRCVELKSPPQNWAKWRILAWELLALYLKSCDKEDILLSPNGRISPRVFLGKKRVFMIVLLDTMNVGFYRLLNDEFGLGEKLNILVNSILMAPSIRRSSCITAISKKTARDFEDYLGHGGLRGKGSDKVSRGIVVYPSGSFRDESLGRRLRPRRGMSREKAIWISGETRNKGFIEGIGLLEEAANDLDVRRVSVYGIRSRKLRDMARRRLMSGECEVEFEQIDTKEEKLIQCYLEANLALCLSKEEGYGIPFLDTLMMGIPVVATKIDTYQEIVELVSGLINTLPPILWVEYMGRGSLCMYSDTVKEFKIQRRRYCAPDEIERIDRYKRIGSLIIERSGGSLAEYISLKGV